MKDGDYINILAPMKSKLKLKGNALMLFALIHGYSKDGKNTCRVSLSYMAEWLDTDKSAVSKLINKLAKAGYINKLEYYSGGVKCFEYTANYEAMLVRSIRGEAMGLESPSVKGGCQNDNGCQNDKKGLSKRQKSVVKMTTNNKDIIIYNNFFCAEPAQQEEEKKNFYKDFFFRNAADPAAEVERFIAYNDSLEWRNSEGRTYETPEKRLGLARLWSFKQEGQWSRPDYLKVIEAIYKSACQDNIEGVEAIIDHKVAMTWDGKQQIWRWAVTPEARRWIEKNSILVHKHLDPITRGIRVTWDMIKAS
jgi:DNA-binding PadR family transcriptional regulator